MLISMPNLNDVKLMCAIDNSRSWAVTTSNTVRALYTNVVSVLWVLDCCSSGSEPHANRIAKFQVVINQSDNICLIGSATLA